MYSVKHMTNKQTEEELLKMIEDGLLNRIINMLDNLEKAINDATRSSEIAHINQMIALEPDFNKQLDLYFKYLDKHPEYKLKLVVK